MERKIGFGIIGCGVIADFHANALFGLSEEAVLVGVADARLPAAERFAKEKQVRAFASVEEMLACPEIDVVTICVPSGLHAELAIKAANAGKHIIVEKPMAITKEQLDAMEEACIRNGVMLSSVAQSRFTSGVRKAKQAIEDGYLGKMVCADVYMKFNRTQEYYNTGGWRGTKAMDGGGALMNQGIHGVDLLLYLAGDVKSVYAVSKTLARQIEVEDTLSAVLEFKSGATGVIQATTSVYPGYPRRLELNGDKGTIVLEEGNLVRWDMEDTTLPEVTLKSNVRSSASAPTDFSADNHTKQFKDVIQALRNGTKPLVDLREGRRAVDLILAIYKSAEEKRVIEL
ncbi:MAG: Gfo/Idh/MocA family oxidoreductase [Clostridia bacterium]|nr:Gfo/Idh/MocA family oxidoreductase [Clostridia bacterium]